VGDNSKFIELYPDEVQSRLKNLYTNGEEVSLWMKGSKVVCKTKLSALDLRDDIFQVYKAKNLDKLNKGAILFHFQINQMKYFGEGRLEKNGIVKVTGKIFKSERRTDFRLMGYPVLNIIAKFDFSKFLEEDKNNILYLDQKKSETRVLKSFLNFLQGDDRVGIAKYKVLDISAKGMSILIPRLDAELFKDDSKTYKFEIDFLGDTFEISMGKIVYNIDYIGSTPLFDKGNKIGFEFMGLPGKIEKELVKKINDNTRDSFIFNEFEDSLDQDEEESDSDN